MSWVTRSQFELINEALVTASQQGLNRAVLYEPIYHPTLWYREQVSLRLQKRGYRVGSVYRRCVCGNFDRYGYCYPACTQPGQIGIYVIFKE